MVDFIVADSTTQHITSRDPDRETQPPAAPAETMSSRTQEVVTENPNEQWLYARGMSIAYMTTVLIVHLALISIPFISTEDAWTLTNALHSLVSIAVVIAKRGEFGSRS